MKDHILIYQHPHFKQFSDFFQKTFSQKILFFQKNTKKLGNFRLFRLEFVLGKFDKKNCLTKTYFWVTVAN